MKLLLENWREYIKEQEEVNEIFGKKKKIVDIDTDDVRRINAHSRDAKELIRDADRYHSYWSTVDSSHRGSWMTSLRISLGDLINKYEREIEPDISRLMIAKSNLEKETHQLDKNLLFRTTSLLKMDHDIEPLPYVEELLSRLIDLRNEILGAYRKHRTIAGMSKYKPKPGMYDLEKLMGQAKVREEGIMDFFRSDSTAPSNTDMSPEEREFHKQQFTFDAEDFQEMSDALKLYKVLMYGGKYKGTGQHQMRKSRKAWTQMGKAGRKRRLKEIAAFHDNVLRPLADKATGYASEIESGTFVDATPRNDYWLGGINPKRIRKMLPKWAKAFESALRVSANFYKNEAPKYGLEEWEPQPGLEDIKDFMDLASIQEE